MRTRSVVTVIICVLAGVSFLQGAVLTQSADTPTTPQSVAAAPVARPTALAPVQAAPPSRFEHFALSGQVLDEKGKPVKGADVTLVDPDTNFKATPVKTDKKGGFTFANLTASSYRLQAKKGQRQSDAVDVSIGAEKTTHKNLVLK